MATAAVAAFKREYDKDMTAKKVEVAKEARKAKSAERKPAGTDAVSVERYVVEKDWPIGTDQTAQFERLGQGLRVTKDEAVLLVTKVNANFWKVAGPTAHLMIVERSL